MATLLHDTSKGRLFFRAEFSSTTSKTFRARNLWRNLQKRKRSSLSLVTTCASRRIITWRRQTRSSGNRYCPEENYACYENGQSRFEIALGKWTLSFNGNSLSI